LSTLFYDITQIESKNIIRVREYTINAEPYETLQPVDSLDVEIPIEVPEQ